MLIAHAHIPAPISPMTSFSYIIAFRSDGPASSKEHSDLEVQNVLKVTTSSLNNILI